MGKIIGLKCNSGLIEVGVVGGLGNQLFGLCLAISEALRRNTDFRIKDQASRSGDKFGLGIFKIDSEEIYTPSLNNGVLSLTQSKSMHLFCKKSIFSETGFSFSSFPSFSSKHIIFDGYFQSYRYFLEHSAEIRAWMREQLNISKNGFLDFSLHVRLGDMAKDPMMRSIHGIVNRHYIERALHYFNSLGLSEPQLITDDPSSLAIIFPDLAERYEVISTDLVSDFRVMCESKNLIIGNSTFAWWAAWIGNGRVVAPSEWFANNAKMGFVETDFYPSFWKVL
jgi:hypothetical protein